MAENTKVGRIYQCNATIVDYTPDKPWFYANCPTCGKRSEQSENEFGCTTCPTTGPPKLQYSLPALIADDTARSSITITDKAAQELLGNTCKQMVIGRCFTNSDDTAATATDTVNTATTTTTPAPGTPLQMQSNITTKEASTKRQLFPAQSTSSAEGVSDTKRLRFLDA